MLCNFFVCLMQFVCLITVLVVKFENETKVAPRVLISIVFLIAEIYVTLIFLIVEYYFIKYIYYFTNICDLRVPLKFIEFKVTL